MDRWSTLNLAMNVFSTALELFDVLKTPELFEAASPYPLIDASATRLDLTDVVAPLPPEYVERNYHILQEQLLRCVVTADFHPTDHLVNFSSLTFARESSPERAIDAIFQNHLPRYLAQRGIEVEWAEVAKDYFIATPEGGDLVLNTRLHYDHPVAIGFAIIRRAYSGI